MSEDRPSQIQAHHLQRLAVEYMRQSTLHQVTHNIGSTEHQRGQTNFALKWGWPPDRIIVIDEDLGWSGTTAAGRHGFQELLRLVGQGQVGGIFCATTHSRADSTLRCRNYSTNKATDRDQLSLDPGVLSNTE